MSRITVQPPGAHIGLSWTGVHHYLHCGLYLASELELPELEAEPAGPVDVRIVVRERRLPPPVTASFESRGAVCRIRQQTADYEVSDGKLITVRPRPRADPRLVRLFVFGTAWGALLHQRGALPLHGGVVRAGTGAVAFCGASGSGKSSTVAALIGRGHDLVSDDLCRLEVTVDGPWVWPSIRRLKLTPEAAVRTGMSGGVHEVDEKLWLRLAGEPVSEPLRLQAIVLPVWGAPAVTPLSGLEAVQRLVAAVTYRPGLYDGQPALTAHWRRCRELAARVPVSELARPREWAALPAALDALALERPAPIG